MSKEAANSATGIDEFDLTGHVALITGSTQGIGLALAEGLACKGASIVVHGRDINRVEQTVDNLNSRGAEATGACFDVTDGNGAIAAIERIEHDAGPISILVNNAGITRRGLFHEQSDDDWTQVLATNVGGIRNVSAPVVRSMLRKGRGKIINLCSLSSEIARPGISAYAMTKGAVKMLTRGLAVELAAHNIQVNGLAPGYIKTALNAELATAPDFDRWVIGRTPARRWGRPQDLVGAAVFLASAASDFVTGQVIYVDGGLLASL